MIDLLLIITAIWLFAASVTDIKKTEVSDWLSFSLLAIALAFNLSKGIISGDFSSLWASLLGVVVFFIIANILYYGKLFAGGDAKILISLGAVIPSPAFLSNILVFGSIYGILYSLFLALRYWKPFWNEFKKYKKLMIYFLIPSVLIALLYFATSMIMLLIFAAIVFFMPLLFVTVNSVEKSCLIRKVEPEKLMLGDWLFKDVKAKGKIIKADFEGLTKRDIALIRKSGKKVFIKYGIPFIPVFLIAFLVTVFAGNILTIFI